MITSYRHWLCLGFTQAAWEEWVSAQTCIRGFERRVRAVPEAGRWSVTHPKENGDIATVASGLPMQRAHDIVDFLCGRARFTLVKSECGEVEVTGQEE